MAVIFWTQADGWSGPNTSSGDLSVGGWSGLARAGSNSEIDTVDAPAGLASAGYKNAWKISGLTASGDAERLQVSVPFDSPNLYTQKLSASGVFVISPMNLCEFSKPVELFSIGDCSVVLYKRGPAGIDTTTSIVLYLGPITGSFAGATSTGIELISYAQAGTPLLFEADADVTATSGSVTLRVYNYTDPDNPSLIGSWTSPNITAQRNITTAFCGGRIYPSTSRSGVVDDYYCAEFQVRDYDGASASHHVKNPYIGYPVGSTWKAEDFADDETLVSDADWDHYSGTSGLLEKSSGVLVASSSGAETCVLADNPILTQGSVTCEISGMQTNDRCGVVIARHKSDFSLSTGSNDTTLDPWEYRVLVDENGGSPELTIILDKDGTPTVLDTTSISSGTTAGTLTVYHKVSGQSDRIYATFDNGTVFTSSITDTGCYASRFGVYMQRAGGAGMQMDNWTLTWQYPSTHDVYELARFCDGTRSNNMVHPCVIQSPKYNQTIIAAQVGPGDETDKSSAIWAWVIPMNGVTSESDILGPVRLDIGNGSTYRAHNPSGATHDGRAVILWGRDDYGSGGSQDTAPGVQDLCGAVHQGGLSFSTTKPLTLGNDAGGTGLDTYRIHFKGQGFQHGSDIVMPGIKTYSVALDAFESGAITITIPLSGTTFGTVTGGTLIAPANITLNEWALYRESDSLWWGICRGGSTTNPTIPAFVIKSTDQGATWALQGDDASETYWPVLQPNNNPLDGATLGGGEYVLTGPLTQNDINNGHSKRKFVTAIPVSANTVFDAGWEFDRADEIQLIWNWSKKDYDTNGMSGYGQVMSTTTGDLMSAYNIRSGDSEKGAQIVLIQIPQSVSGYTPWENTFLGSGGAGRMGLEMDLLL
jgi:hypothetical protein